MLMVPLAAAVFASSSVLAAPTGSIFFNSNPVFGDVVLILNGTLGINASNTGWYRDSGAGNQPGGSNFIAGLCSNCGSSLFRDFLAFTIPAGLTVTSAALRVNTFTYDSLNASEVFSLFDVSTSLTSILAGTGGVAAYDDFGTGVSYGSRVYTAADSGQFRSIGLNAAAVNAIQNSSGQSFVMGGVLDDATTVPEPSTVALVLGAFGMLAAQGAARRRNS
jgi:hypothetical protein